MKKFLLIAIIIIAAVLRLYRINEIPPGVNRDEAAIGYTAYSLMTTGRDEYGKSLPLSFESFGDWKLPLYIYTTIPFVKVFGLSELSVRLPSALAGTVTVAALYYLSLLLFSSQTVALTAAAVLAINPWHIHISRVESEAIVAVMLSVLGLIAFLHSLKKRSLPWMFLSSVLFALTYYTYHGNHVTTSLILAALAIIYGKDISKVKRWWTPVLLGAGMTVAILAVTVSADRTKIGGISIFGDPFVVHERIELPRTRHDNPSSLIARVAHNRVTYAIKTVTENYMKSYGPEFLFIKGGGNSAHNIGGFGNLYPIEAPLLLLGIFWLLINHRIKNYRIILWWIILSGIAPAITKDAPHTNRMLMVVPAFAIAISGGLHLIVQFTHRYTYRLIFLFVVIGYLFSAAVYLDRYYTHFPKEEAANWGLPYKRLASILFSPEYMDKPVIMTEPETSRYIYLLFYSGYDPARYQNESMRLPVSADGFTDVSGFGRFSFRPIDWQADASRKDTLLVVDTDELPASRAPMTVAEIRLPDGTPKFSVLYTGK